MLKEKPMISSKTIRVGTVYISLGILIAILQAFDMLETVLVSISAEIIPPDVAAWVGVALAIIGGIQVWLRMITDRPIGNEPPNQEVALKATQKIQESKNENNN